MTLQTIDDIDVEGKRVLMRADFNVPLTADGRIADTPHAERIDAALDTVRSVLERGGRLIVTSHLGRPAGRGAESGLTLRPCAERLGERLGREVGFASDCVGPEAEQRVEALGNGEALVLENLRFHREEQANDPGFAKSLAALADVYCNEAFPTLFRRHASLAALPEAMADRPRVAGRLLMRELAAVDRVAEGPERRLAVVAGGREPADRIRAMRRLLPRTDTLMLGGALAHTFMQAAGRETGESPVDRSAIEDARALLDEADRHRTRLFLPEDHVGGRDLSSETDTDVFEEAVPAGWYGLDIGPKTINRYTGLLAEAETILWSGPLGAFETEPFEVGTREVATAVAERTGAGATSFVTGGHTAIALRGFGVADRISHIATGRDASLKRLAGDRFPALEALDGK